MLPSSSGAPYVENIRCCGPWKELFWVSTFSYRDVQSFSKSCDVPLSDKLTTCDLLICACVSLQIELVTSRHELNYEMRTLRIQSLHTVSTVAAIYGGRMRTLQLCVWTNCYSSCHGHVTHYYEYASFGAFHSVQLIQQSTTDFVFTCL